MIETWQHNRSFCPAIIVFDIDGVVRDVGNSYRRAIADTVEHFTAGAYRPTSADIDALKSEGIWNNDWEASQEFIYRYESQTQIKTRSQLDYQAIVAFFQSRYRGLDNQNWTGYICNEPLLLQPTYLEQLTAAGMAWGFFSGAPRAEAVYLLEKRLGLSSPVLIAMEDAPGKPDPTGLFATVRQLENQSIDKLTPVVYCGDTVADMYTVEKARSLFPDRTWIGVGVLPPHLHETSKQRDAYAERLRVAGAVTVVSHIEQLSVIKLQEFLARS